MKKRKKDGKALIIAKMWQSEKSKTDVDGSWTGVAENKNEKPKQDADDL